MLTSVANLFILTSNMLRHNLGNFTLLTLLTIIWGSSYILIKKSLLGFSPIELACLRVGISCIVTLPLVIKAVKSISREKYLAVLGVGVFGSAAPALLFALSLTKTGSGLNGIINSLTPLWTIILGVLWYQLHISTQKIIGVVIGFLGAVILVLGQTGKMVNTNLFFGVFPFIATFCYGLSSNLTKQKLQDESAVYTTALAMVMVGIPALVGLSFTGAPAKIMSGTVWLPFVCVATLSVFGTVIAWTLFYRLVQRTDALYASSVTYLVPIVALAWAWFDHESLSAVQFIGMLLIFAGVYFTTTAKNLLRR